jgi:Tfp pilus assembly protein PilO
MKSYRRFYRLYKKYIRLGALVAAMAALAVFGIMPGLGAVQKIAQETDGLKSEVSAMKKKIDTLNAMDDTQLSDVAQALRLAVPTDKDVAGIMMGTQALMSQYSIAIDSLTLTGGAVASDAAGPRSGIDRKLGIGVVPLSMSVVGPVSGIRDMLDNVTKVRRMMNITMFDLSIGGAASASGTVRSNINAQLFFQPPPANIGKISDPIAPLSSAEQELITNVSSMPVVSDLMQVTGGQVEMPSEVGRDNPFIP